MTRGDARSAHDDGVVVRDAGLRTLEAFLQRSRVQEASFDLGEEIRAITRGNMQAGGIVSFVGTVRDMSGGRQIEAMTLEHYPGMTERALAEIEAEANGRWPLEASLIVHRVGRMLPGDEIVLVATAAAHREAAFEACEFLIDWLKTKAPFWKLEAGGGTAAWVDARAEDDQAAARWHKDAAQ